jgi:hypothetical protein
VAYWVEHHGQTSEDLAASFVGSREYFNAGFKSYGEKAAWVRAAYLDILHRAANDDEVQRWLGVLPLVFRSVLSAALVVGRK